MSDNLTAEEREVRWRAKGILTRPPYQLRQLPLRYRWEVTRRHPYYVQYWPFARQHYLQEPYATDEELSLRCFATSLLGRIGVRGELPDPKLSFEEMEPGALNSAWLSGAVHPVSCRGLTALLIALLPPETLEGIGNLLVDASYPDTPDCPREKHQALDALERLRLEGLDSYSPMPFVSIDPSASERQIIDAISELVPRWKAERGLTDQRVRHDKFEEYFDVWDRREGWQEGRYDDSKALKLKEIAQQVGRSVPTVSNQYCSAFELITGHSFVRELRFSLFANLMWRTVCAQNSNVALRRPSTSPVRRDMPESTLGTPESIFEQGIRSKAHDPRVKTLRPRVEITEDDTWRDYWIDVKDLTDQGHCISAIADKLEVSEEQVQGFQAISGSRRDED